MDNRFGEMQLFLAVAQGGSFAAAAKALRVTPSAVSRGIARLEARLGVQLVARTTRALALTPDGEAYRRAVSGLMAEIDTVERGLGGGERGPSGLLRINASVPFGTQCLLPILPDFLDRYRAITVELALSDAVVELVEERADVAIRIGPLRDNNLKAKKLGRSRLLIVAAPAYLARRGTPRHPADLADHDALRFSFRRSIDTWPFRIDGRIVQRAVEGPFLGNSGEVVREMAVAGGGIARLAHFHVAADLSAGRLVELLQPHDPGDAEDIHALYVGHDRLAARVRAFLDYLGERLVIS